MERTRFTPELYSMRAYAEATTDPFAPYVGIASLAWESPTVIWIRGMHGAVTRAHLRDLCRFCLARGIQTIKAHRDSARRLPFGERDPIDGHVEISVAEAAARYKVQR